ncbi:hypothetical protein BDZ97DRAFT_1969332 [Flammula alnicola]|nr:hypothetical protein BDZ97DRAFT_1969332 [Flammula alnicola]
MPTFSKPILPLELLRLIISHLRECYPALYALSLTSKTLRGEVEHLLYSNMTSASEVAHAKFLTTILHSRRCATLVHAYSQEGVSNQGKQRLWSLLSRGLKEMINLQHLCLRASLLDGYAGSLSGCSFQLESFDCRGSHMEEEEISTFLSTQRNLKQLNIEWRETSNVALLPSACPALQLLRGNRGAIEAFLPGKLIASLAWIPHPSDSISSIDHLAPYLNHLRTLSYGGSFKRPRLELIVGHLQSLEFLKVVDPASEFSRRNYPPPIGPPHQSQWATAVPNIFSDCKLLEYIDISVQRANYERWTPGSDHPERTSTSFEQVHAWWEVGRRARFPDELEI